MTRDFSSTNPRWVEGRIRWPSGPMPYDIRLEDGRVVRRHMGNGTFVAQRLVIIIINGCN